MNKVFSIAIREFLATAMTKAFVFGILAVPAIGGLVLLLATLGLFETPPPKAEGTILVLDKTESAFVAEGLETFYSPEAMQTKRQEMREKIQEATENIPMGSEQQKEMATDMAVQQLTPDVDVERLPEDADLEQAKQRVKDPSDDAFLLFVVDDRSVETPPSDAELRAAPESEREEASARGTFEVYQAKDVRAQVVNSARDGVRDLIIEQRIRAAGLDPEQISELQRPPRSQTRTLTDAGEKASAGALSQLLPFAFFMLLWVSVMSGGQYLLMSTIEEKSTRVMEILLSAISPTQLLLGKIVGQGAVGILILALYGGIGIFAANYFDVLALIPTRLLVWALFYFFVAYAFFASLMAAAGSAVSDIREAQSLTSPIMFLLIIPFFLWVPITQAPQGVLATGISFVPPLTPFVMVLRMSQPGVELPIWELAATTLVALLGVAVMVFAAVKIFRVGVLMYGKPPSFWGLLKWIRYA